MFAVVKCVREKILESSEEILSVFLNWVLRRLYIYDRVEKNYTKPNVASEKMKALEDFNTYKSIIVTRVDKGFNHSNFR